MIRKLVEAEYGGHPDNVRVERNGNEVHVDLVYPSYTPDEAPERCHYVVVNQESVRASDGVRLSYDYGRDGWVIEQPHVNEETGDERWVETAFVQSWAQDEWKKATRSE